MVWSEKIAIFAVDMKERLFRFKQFSVLHSRSAMKVGVDGVLTGAWGDVEGCKTILDAGCGCGLIALMCAQRNPDALITGVEIEPNAVGEASENFANSPWSNRLRAVVADLNEWTEDERYDLIISNPPFFNSGVTKVDDERQMARHGVLLSPMSLLCISKRLLNPTGRLVLILPDTDAPELTAEAHRRGLVLTRITHVRGHEAAPFKRALCEYRFADAAKNCNLQEDTLTLNEKGGEPTGQYRSLCRDFYLKF